jgi:hypothetical protein
MVTFFPTSPLLLGYETRPLMHDAPSKSKSPNRDHSHFLLDFRSSFQYLIHHQSEEPPSCSFNGHIGLLCPPNYVDCCAYNGYHDLSTHSNFFGTCVYLCLFLELHQMVYHVEYRCPNHINNQFRHMYLNSYILQFKQNGNNYYKVLEGC